VDPSFEVQFSLSINNPPVELFNFIIFTFIILSY